MRRFKDLPVLCGMALVFAACAVPLGEDYLITRDGSGAYITDYELQNYVPIPKTGERPVSVVNQGNLDIMVVWKDSAGTEISLPFDEFRSDTVYQAEIKLSAKDGYGFYPSTPFAYPDGKVSFQYDDLGEPSRIIRVIYNNSDDADFTFITDYNLQRYVPIPLAGEKPVRAVTNRLDLTVEASWKVEDPPNPGTFVDIPAGDSYTFALDAVYQANIQLTAKPGYRFSSAMNFEYPAGVVSIQPGPDSDPAERVLTTIRYQATRAGTTINDLSLTPYIARPVSGAAALGSFTGIQYAGTIVWKNTGTQALLTGPFQPDTEYTAEVTLTPAVGYIFTGIGTDTFIHTGAKGVSNGADSGTIRIEFPATPAAGILTVVYDTNLTGRISRPINGVTPVLNIAGIQYTGTVTWTPAHGAFQLGGLYTAVITLKAAPGYTFAGIGQNAFTHDDAPGAVVNAAGNGVVTIAFPPAASSAHPAASFGPVTAGDSALGLMKEKRDYIYSLYIDLPAGMEDVGEGATLAAGDNSPANVTIDGHGRVLRIQDGVLLTVSGDVSLTLKNITIQGKNGNPTPLFKVWPGGKLILGEGVTLLDNKSSGDTGGVWVNGGVLVMNARAAVKAMKGRRAGGVFIDGGGRFVMNGGTIGGEDPDGSDGNQVSGDHGGGGVLVVQGTFDMNGGVIQSNTAAAAYSGGGVAVLAKGTFNQYGGTITENTAAYENSAGGVYVVGNFTMHTLTAVIEKNTTRAAYSGGGVYIDGDEGTSFVMTNGIIRENTAENANSGGGLFFSHYHYNDWAVTSFINGGAIQGNKTRDNNSGGGIYVARGNIEMYSGRIQGNEALGNSSGGGVYLADGAVPMLSMTGAAAIIESNIAWGANSGGGAYSASRRGINIQNGSIQNNKVMERQSGGGVYIASPNGSSSLSSGGVIKGNSAEWSSGTAYDDGSGGGVYMAGGDFSNYGGIIGGENPARDANTAGIGANGVYIAGGYFRLQGKITGNTAPGTNDYGVYIKYTAVEAFTMDSTEAVVTEDNMVFLCSGATISIGRVNSLPNPAANIICENDPPVSYNVDTNLATKLLSCSSVSSGTNYLTMNKGLFLYNGGGVPVKITGPIGSWPDYYGYYNE
jgi:hypothetical protein